MIRPRIALLIPTLASTLFSLVLLTACGGGGGSTPPPGSPVANLSASTVTFAGQTTGTTSSPVKLTLSNTGTAALNIAGISIANANGIFAQTNTCGASLGAGANCAINLTFSPTQAGSRAVALNVTDNAAGSPQSVTIKGNGVTPSNGDPMGTASGIETSCSSIKADLGEPNGTCYNLETTCPGIADQTVGVKVNNPSGTKGTVTFIVGGAGMEWYDQTFNFGTTAVDMVAQAGFTTAQIAFYAKPANYPPNGTFAGWLSGPGAPGLRSLSCRFATVSMWVRDHIRQQNAPFCHTGNSAGSGAPFYALAYYGFNSYYNFVELTSGPPFTHIEKGCICNPQQSNTVSCGGVRSESECYGPSDAFKYLDPAYDPTTHICSDSLGGDITHKQTFINDSLDTPAAAKNFPNVDIHFVFGGLDPGPEQPQALELIQVISAKNPITYACVLDAQHPIADVLDGAQQIASDVIAGCH
jgi:hypothetical protein